MLKIKIWMRGTFEYSQDTIPGPTEDQTQEQFEESFTSKFHTHII